METDTKQNLVDILSQSYSKPADITKMRLISNKLNHNFECVPKQTNLTVFTPSEWKNIPIPLLECVKALLQAA
jgi:hypothetical protein